MVTKKKRPPRNPKKFKSPRHRTLAKNIIKAEGDEVKAYRMTYPNASLASAQHRASAVLKKYPEIINNTRELLNKQGLTKAVMNERLSIMLASEDEKTTMDAIKTIYKLHGDLQSGTNINIDQREQSVNISTGSKVDGEKLTRTLTQFRLMNEELTDKNYAQLGEIDVEDAQFEG